MDPWSIFLYGMKAPMTREKYTSAISFFEENISRHLQYPRQELFASSSQTIPLFIKASIFEKIARTFMICHCSSRCNLSRSWIFIF
jgi:hypothetical protein